MGSVFAARSMEEKFWANVTTEPNTGCWLWLGTLTADKKYGRFFCGGRKGGRRKMAHHYSYEIYVGPIPSGMEIHHKCNVGWCVNPGHLIPLTKLENLAIRNSGELPTVRTWAKDTKSVAKSGDIKSHFKSFIKLAKSGCWEWQGGNNGRYGLFSYGGRQTYAHRASYLLFTGRLDSALEIDHTCNNPICVNPAHLEQVSRSENEIRKHLRNRGGNFCARGHEFTAENTYLYPGGAGRRCHECRRIGVARRKHKLTGATL